MLQWLGRSLGDAPANQVRNAEFFCLAVSHLANHYLPTTNQS